MKTYLTLKLRKINVEIDSTKNLWLPSSSSYKMPPQNSYEQKEHEEELSIE